MSNSLDPDQDQHSVGPNLGPNCLQRLSAYNKNAPSKQRVKPLCQTSMFKILVKFSIPGAGPSSSSAGKSLVNTKVLS